MGGAYLISRPAVPRLLAAAQITPVLLLEDVYVTGLCAAAGNVELIPDDKYVSVVSLIQPLMYATCTRLFNRKFLLC